MSQQRNQAEQDRYCENQRGLSFSPGKFSALSCFGCRNQCEGGGRSNYQFGYSSLFPSQQLQAQQGDTWGDRSELELFFGIVLFSTIMFLLTLPASDNGVVLKGKETQLCESVFVWGVDTQEISQNILNWK